jgi:hypothetical protein
MVFSRRVTTILMRKDTCAIPEAAQWRRTLPTHSTSPREILAALRPSWSAVYADGAEGSQLSIVNRWDEFFMLFGAQRPMKTG